ncbi:hypothetical protein CKO_04428 [Citrobacter koseri ATCC BAA-895]|uniref:Uncharacterized protein n=1 Tax=Citrobacter koseri (strain ATCC BAA-895 / CDC 4225-83 / SGSC4696) TaxID=290338 RepID=A8APS1_CITK8|nr:hypothetical protein CKO_04428 [Citrobacter koseri ATCC BAA-895]
MPYVQTRFSARWRDAYPAWNQVGSISEAPSGNSSVTERVVTVAAGGTC